MRLNNFWLIRKSGRLLLPLMMAAASLLTAQNSILSVSPPAKLMGKKNSTLTAKIAVSLRNGFHVNSNKPADDYLIPLRLTWTPEPLSLKEVQYPAPRMEKYEFSEKPLSVYSGDFELTTQFQIPATAPNG